ncbi:MAG: lamin tail domain-containing protein [Elusimicrobia bacterium]|nr:lamin tail domain-containing protein [Elusimicrobiota bacterium]
MFKIIGLVLLLLTANCQLRSAFAVSPGDVVINEIMWMGNTAYSNDEWIELRNMTKTDINIDGWDITKWNSADKEELMLTVPAGKIIPAEGYFLIAHYSSSNSSSTLNIEPDFVKPSITLSNSNLQIKLYGGKWDNGAILVDIAGDSGVPLAGDNSKKYSMERIDPPGDGTNFASWQTAMTAINWDATATEKGTPKAANSKDIIPPGSVPDLSASTGLNTGEIDLTWTAPAEDNSEGGTVASYDLRYATMAFSEIAWNQPWVYQFSLNGIIPKKPGEKETLTISGLDAGATYYFAIKSQDEVSQVSPIDVQSAQSNQACARAQVKFTARITEVSFASAVDWVELYNYGDTALDISHFMLTDLDGTTDTAFAELPVTLPPGKYAVVYWDEAGIDETNVAGDLNGNGVIDLYVSDTSLSATDDQIVLMSAASGGQFVDTICWANQSGGFSPGEENDLLLLSGQGMWKLGGAGPSEADCVNSKDITVDQSFGRLTATAVDNNDSSDWKLFKLPTPGKDNPELVPPKVTLLFDPPPPFTTGRIKVSLNIEAGNLIGKEPQISYFWGLEPAQPLSLIGADKAWVGELTIPAHSEERNIIFQYTVEDIAQNITVGEVTALGLAQELPSEQPAGDDKDPGNPAVEYKIRITEVAFAASIDWVELYNYGETAVDIADFMLTDLDGIDTKIADQKTTLAPGKYAIVYWDDAGIDETDAAGDFNNNGFIDLYVSDTSLSATDDQIVLMSAASGGQFVDAACWSTGLGEFSSGEDKDIRLLADNKQWIIAGGTVTKSDCWSDTNKITSEQAIGRLNPTAPDTDSKNDWHLFKLPTPGQDNPSLLPPIITLLFDPEPPFKAGQIKISLHIGTLNSITAAPEISFNEGVGDFQNITLSGADKTWQGVFEISQNEAERNVSFKYKVSDQAKNSTEQEIMYLGLAYVPPEYGERMYCFPNPWAMNSGQNLKFSNLGVDESTIKIFTLHGELVKMLTGQGDAYWDGTNENGEKVAAGIYVYCLGNAQCVKKGKIAILK